MNTEILFYYTDEQGNDVRKCEDIITPFVNQLGNGSISYSKISSDRHKFFTALKKAYSYNNILFICCETDIAVECISKLLDEAPAVNEEFSSFAARNNRNDLCDVVFPKNSYVFFDRSSFYAGFIKKILNKVIVHIPMVPEVTHNMLSESIIPYFSDLYNKNYSNIRIRVFDINNDIIQRELDNIRRKHYVNITIQNNNGVTDIVLSHSGQSAVSSDLICSNAISDISSALGKNIFEIGSRSIAQVCVESLKRNSFTIATAESCTGGMLSEAITSIEGSSRVLEMGICAYSNKIKSEVVGVDKEILSAYGAISKETAAELAKGVKEKSGATLGIGITGVAGPSSCEGKPVGTVFVCIYDGNYYWLRNLTLGVDKTRDYIREYAVNTALDLVRKYVASYPETLDGACSKDNLTDIKSINTTPKREAAEVVNELRPNNVSYSENDYFISDEDDDKENYVEHEIFFSEPEFIGKNYEPDDLPLQKETPEDSAFLNDLLTESQKPKKDIKLLSFFKSKDFTKKIVKISFVVIAVILVFACIFASTYFIRIFRDLSQLNNARDIYSQYEYLDVNDKLTSKNSDYTGWLSINGTKINNPVYQTVDNTYYTTHNMKKQNSRYGALYFDYRNTVKGDDISTNLVIYGRNMHDGAMFGELSKYQDLSFLSENSDITLSLENSTSTYKVYAVVIMNSVKNDDNGYLFPFTKTSFEKEIDFDSWISELSERSLYKTDITATYGDEFLTLVTTNKAFNNARLVVIAKKVSDESLNAVYTVNESPRYPKAWYDERNLEFPWNN